MNSQRILVSGSSGPIGAALLPALKARGFSSHAPGARPQPLTATRSSWDPSRPLSPDSVSGFDAVIHLAGESIVGRWTDAKKRRIIESRVQGTSHLAEAAAKASQPPRVFISASAIGFYGNRGDEILREDSPSGEGFAAEICRQWEAGAQPAAQAGIRTAQMRIGVVMSADGGALPEMLPAISSGSGRQTGQRAPVVDLGLGARRRGRDPARAGQRIALRSGQHRVAPNPVTNAEFTRTLASVLNRPAIFPMPAFAVRLIFGEMGEELFLGSQRVEPAKLAATGYQFQHPDLKNALKEILQR